MNLRLACWWWCVALALGSKRGHHKKEYNGEQVVEVFEPATVITTDSPSTIVSPLPSVPPSDTPKDPGLSILTNTSTTPATNGSSAPTPSPISPPSSTTTQTPPPPPTSPPINASTPAPPPPTQTPPSTPSPAPSPTPAPSIVTPTPGSAPSNATPVTTPVGVPSPSPANVTTPAPTTPPAPTPAPTNTSVPTPVTATVTTPTTATTPVPVPILPPTQGTAGNNTAPNTVTMSSCRPAPIPATTSICTNVNPGEGVTHADVYEDYIGPFSVPEYEESETEDTINDKVTHGTTKGQDLSVIDGDVNGLNIEYLTGDIDKDDSSSDDGSDNDTDDLAVAFLLTQSQKERTSHSKAPQDDSSNESGNNNSNNKINSTTENNATVKPPLNKWNSSFTSTAFPNPFGAPLRPQNRTETTDMQPPNDNNTSSPGLPSPYTPPDIMNITNKTDSTHSRTTKDGYTNRTITKRKTKNKLTKDSESTHNESSSNKTDANPSNITSTITNITTTNETKSHPFNTPDLPATTSPFKPESNVTTTPSATTDSGKGKLWRSIKCEAMQYKDSPDCLVVVPPQPTHSWDVFRTTYEIIMAELRTRYTALPLNTPDLDGVRVLCKGMEELKLALRWCYLLLPNTKSLLPMPQSTVSFYLDRGRYTFAEQWHYDAVEVRCPNTPQFWMRRFDPVRCDVSNEVCLARNSETMREVEALSIPEAVNDTASW